MQWVFKQNVALPQVVWYQCFLYCVGISQEFSLLCYLFYNIIGMCVERVHIFFQEIFAFGHYCRFKLVFSINRDFSRIWWDLQTILCCVWPIIWNTKVLKMLGCPNSAILDLNVCVTLVDIFWVICSFSTKLSSTAISVHSKFLKQCWDIPRM